MSAADLMYEAARKAVALPSLWAQYGWPTATKAGRVVSPVSPCCGESSRGDALSMHIDKDDVWRWKCFRCGQGGSAIDAEVLVMGLTHYQAAKRLVENNGGISRITGRAMPKPGERKAKTLAAALATRKALDALIANEKLDPNVRAYLRGRGISDATIQGAIDRGILRATPASVDSARDWWNSALSQEEQRASGLLRAGARVPACAYRPLVFLSWDRGGCEFRTIGGAKGPKAIQFGRPQRPIVWVPVGTASKIAIVEGGYDVLSMIDLGWHSTVIVGLLGSGSWRDAWITEFAQLWPDSAWHVGLDPDESGDTASEAIIKAVKQAGLRAVRERPWGGGDWNDLLVASRKAFG